MLPAKAQSGVLFAFSKAILQRSISPTDDARVLDADVGAAIYPGYPYSPYWKQGKKDVGRAIEMDLLARNLGVPLQWIIRILLGELSLDGALNLWESRRSNKKNEALNLRQFDRGGRVDIELHLKQVDADFSAIFAQNLQAWLDQNTELKP